MWIWQQRLFLWHPTWIENVTIPSMIKIKFGLRFRLRGNCSCNKTKVSMSQVKIFFKQCSCYSICLGRTWEVNSSRKESPFLPNYSPNLLHFSLVRGLNMEEMHDFEFICVSTPTCVCLHPCVCVCDFHLTLFLCFFLEQSLVPLPFLCFCMMTQW